MIKIEKEPDEFKHFPLEHCFFCDKPTEYWAKEGDTPVCPKCAKSHEESDIAQY